MKKHLIKALSLSLMLTSAQSAHAENLLDLLFGRHREPRKERQVRQRPKTEVRTKLPKDYFPPPPMTQPVAQKAVTQNLGAWVLKKTSWDEIDEMFYSEFVRDIGRSGCRTVDSCIRSPANPFRDTDPSPEVYKFWSDCADFPYFLRSYFAWKNGLPMAFAQGMTPLPLNEAQLADLASGAKTAQNDVRYSWNGNRASSRSLVPNQKTGSTDFFQNHIRMQNSVHTATYRVDPRTDGGDMYTPAITRGGIRPGTAVYDPNGHVGVVYDVTADGQVMVFDALVDTQSVSPRRPYSSDFYKRSKSAHGGWLQNFRPVVVEGAVFDPSVGGFVGGRARLFTNTEIPDFSLEMFGNTQTADGKSAYVVDDKVTTSFQEFLRRRLFKGKYKVDAVAEFKLRLNTICEDFESRVGLVQNATTHGIAFQPHTPKLPDTIYGGEGDWDVYSTPGGDVRRRNSVNLALTAAKELKSHVDQRHPDYPYQGKNLKTDMIHAAQEVLQTCKLSYQNSIGQKVTLNLGQLLGRMHRMSFSPYHCIELRWGADTREELASCRDVQDPEKVRWFRAQQSLRNQMTRDTNLFTGYTLEQLEQKAASLGPALPESFDMLKRLQTEL